MGQIRSLQRPDLSKAVKETPSQKLQSLFVYIVLNAWLGTQKAQHCNGKPSQIHFRTQVEKQNAELQWFHVC